MVLLRFYLNAIIKIIQYLSVVVHSFYFIPIQKEKIPCRKIQNIFRIKMPSVQLFCSIWTVSAESIPIVTISPMTGSTGILLRNCSNSYFYWLRRAISDLYNFPVNAAHLKELDSAIAKAYEDPNHHLRILEEQCRYDRILLDNYTHPGQVESTGKLFVPVLRCNMFAVCNCKSRKDHNGNNPSMYIPGIYEKNFDGYLEMISQYIRQYRVLKFAIAYDEGNRVRNFSKSRAAAAYGQENPSEAAYRDFYEYMVYYICRLAGEHGLVVQIHTGLGTMNDTSPIYRTPRLICFMEATPGWTISWDFSIIIQTSMQISAGSPLSAHRQLNDSCGKRWRLVETIASSGAVIPGPPRKVTVLFWHSVGWWRKCSQRCVRRATSAAKRPAIQLDKSGAAMRSGYLALKDDAGNSISLA